MHHLSLLTVCLALAAAPCARAATDVQGPAGLLAGQVPDNVAALKRVAITGFVVQYVTDFGIETTRSRGGTFFSKWKNVTPEMMQATTQALQAQLVADLKAGGLDVLAPEQVLQQPGLAEVRSAARASPAVVNDSSLRKVSVLVSAGELPLVLAPVPDVKLSNYATQLAEGSDPPRQIMGWERQASQWLMPGNVEVMSLAGIFIGQAKVAESLNATALNVRLTVPLVDLGVTVAANAGGNLLFGGGKITGLIKPNPRFVEAGTVFSFSQAGGNPGHRHVLGLQKPVAIEGLGVTTNLDKVTLDETIFGKQSARGSGLLGALFRGGGGNTEEADFWVSVEAAAFQPALVKAAGPIFKELTQILAGAK